MSELHLSEYGTQLAGYMQITPYMQSGNCVSYVDKCKMYFELHLSEYGTQLPEYMQITPKGHYDMYDMHISLPNIQTVST